MKIFSRLKIESAKQVGTLYHLTNLTGMTGILKSNSLKKSNLYDGISFTRNKMLNFYKSRNKNLFFKLIIDGDKLSENYKIHPKQYITQKGIPLFESEEFIESNEIKNISKYITGVAFVANNWELYNDNFLRLDNDQYIVEDNEKAFKKQDILNIMKVINSKYNLMVQTGSTIKKNDNWFKEMGLL